MDYGEAERLSDGQDEWECRSQELYDSDNPECPLNAYHIESKPRLVNLEDFDDKGRHCRLKVSYLEVPTEQEQIQSKKNVKRLNLGDNKNKETI